MRPSRLGKLVEKSDNTTALFLEPRGVSGTTVRPSGKVRGDGLMDVPVGAGHIDMVEPCLSFLDE